MKSRSKGLGLHTNIGAGNAIGWIVFSLIIGLLSALCYPLGQTIANKLVGQ